MHVLSKDCNFRQVSAEEYRLDLVRNAFINGLASHQIRQRLLESNESTVDQAFNRARSLQQALEYSAAYASYETQNDLAATSAALEEGNRTFPMSHPTRY